MATSRALDLIAISTDMVLESREHIREVKKALRAGGMTVIQARAETTLIGHGVRGARVLQGNYIALTGNSNQGQPTDKRKKSV